uniref:Uncharacterized protein n=1 Tax=Oryza brachyantha TaxID=4533 RepID=J3LTY6_ORYBR
MEQGGELQRGSAAAARHEGWMLRSIVAVVFDYSEFVDEQVPVKALQIDGNCRVEDRGLKTYHGQMVYVLCIYNKKEKEDQITVRYNANFHVQNTFHY